LPVLWACRQGCWQYGHAKKKSEDGVDVGTAEDGFAYYGNLCYEDFGDVDDAIFLMNMPRAVLGHPTVLVHELTHAFHHRIGWDAVPLLSAAYSRAVAIKAEIPRHFKILNPTQFEVTFINQEEFLAYLSEAYHSRPRDYSRHGVIYEAPAFPTNRAELQALDDKFGIGVFPALEQAIGLGAEGGVARPLPPVPVPVPEQSAARVYAAMAGVVMQSCEADWLKRSEGAHERRL